MVDPDEFHGVIDVIDQILDGRAACRGEACVDFGQALLVFGAAFVRASLAPARAAPRPRPPAACARPNSSRSFVSAAARSFGSVFRYEENPTIWMTPPFFFNASN